MSYETHVTMAINCITTLVYVYAVFELITGCLLIIASTAKHVPPTDCFAMFFNLWFGFLTICIITVTMPLLRSLFFADVYKLKIAQSDCSIIGYTKDGNAFKCSINESCGKIIDVASNLINKIVDRAQLSPSKRVTPDTPTAAQTTQASSAQPPKSPDAPDSEQCSQTSTERFADNQGEIEPVGV